MGEIHSPSPQPKIQFVEMGELLPEFWSGPRDKDLEVRRAKPRRSRKVLDIHTWVQCFLTYVATRALRTHPDQRFRKYIMDGIGLASG